MWHVVIATLLVVGSALPALEVIPPERLEALPADARAIVTELIAVVTKEIAEATAEVEQERRDLIDDLRDEFDKYTRRGRLEPAQAIQARLKELAPPPPAAAADLLGVQTEVEVEPEPEPTPAPLIAADEALELPPTAARNDAAYEKALMRTATDTAKRIYRERDDAVGELERQVVALTKQGLLAEASLVQSERDALAELHLAADFLGPVIMLPLGGAVKRGDLALSERGATVAGTTPVMIDGITTGHTGSTGFSADNWPCAFTVDLQQAWSLRQIRLLLWDGDQRFYRYSVEVSPDGETWAMLADRSQGEWRSWQTLDLPHPAPVRYIRVNGSYNSVNAGFHVVELEAYCVPPTDAATPRFASSP